MNNLLNILKKFNERRIVVIGDIMLDKSINGDVLRISPEAPVQIVNIKEESYEPGGAANVASNISSLGGKVSLFGFVGKDENAKILSELLTERKIDYFLEENSLTTLKVRVRGGNQQLLRLDYEESSPKDFGTKIKDKLEREIMKSDLILVSDYAKGVIHPNLMNFLRSFNKKIIVDPKPQNCSFYTNSFLITPNEKEALEMSGNKNVYDAGVYLRKKLNCNVLITRGEKGMTLFSDNETDIPTVAKEVYDVTGAGDTVIATLSLSLASGASLEEGVVLANNAAGIAVSKVGTYQVKMGELEKRIFGEEKKLKNTEELSSIIDDLRKKQKKIVWTNGCFDILHPGHTKYLSKAKEQGDYLIVGLNSDESVRKLKGEGRPIYNQNQRAEVLSSLSCVDFIIIYSEPTSKDYLSMFKPDIFAKGGDYTMETINLEERKIVEGYNGKITFIDVGEKTSTTKTIEKIKKFPGLGENLNK